MLVSQTFSTINMEMEENIFSWCSGCRVLMSSLLGVGEIPCENSLLRQVSSLLRRLPTIESEKFRDDFLMVGVV